MAEELWRELSPHMTPDVQLTLAGHSLGGSLAVLLTCMARLRLGIPGAQLRCLAFGSPPVLSLLTSMGCTDVLQVQHPSQLRGLKDHDLAILQCCCLMPM